MNEPVATQDTEWKPVRATPQPAASAPSEADYTSPPPKHAMTVKAQYVHTGKLAPPRFDLPCPFCGGRAVETIYSGAPTIACDSCPATMGGEESTHSAEELRAAWNRRASDADPR